MGGQENPRAYISRALRTWRNVTGNDPDVNQMEKAIMQAKKFHKVCHSWSVTEYPKWVSEVT